VGGWIDAAKWEAARLRVHPEQFPHLTRAEQLQRAAELEECVWRVTKYEREPREGPAWVDFENEADE
jgi:hypothetical protein